MDRVLGGEGGKTRSREVLTVTIQVRENSGGTSAIDKTVEGRAKRTCSLDND